VKLTEVRVVGHDVPREDHPWVESYLSIALDDELVLHDVKVIHTLPDSESARRGRPRFLSMPQHPKTDRCRACGAKTLLLAKFCQACGKRLGADRDLDANGERIQVYYDVVHPINDARVWLEREVFARLDGQGVVMRGNRDDSAPVKEK
jgi:DNA-binding cell septation regulator SpoVG